MILKAVLATLRIRFLPAIDPKSVSGKCSGELWIRPLTLRHSAVLGGHASCLQYYKSSNMLEASSGFLHYYSGCLCISK